jgi:glycine dehydrogenase
MKINVNNIEKFENRHNGPSNDETLEMLSKINVNSIEELIAQTVPASIRLKAPLNLPKAKSEFEFLSEFKKIANKNKVFNSYIGMGYYGTIVPGVIQRNILENPGWYTAYTPYQAEIAQGRLEALINFQTMVIDLTGMEIANASLLDEGTAAAEAMAMLHATRNGEKKKIANKFFVDKNTFPQTVDVLKTRSTPFGIELVIDDITNLDLEDEELYGVLVQYPDGDGQITDYTEFVEAAHANDVAVCFAVDINVFIIVL